MMIRIQMDVAHQSMQITFFKNQFSFKWSFKERSCSIIRSINRLGVAVENMRKRQMHSLIPRFSNSN